VLFSRISAYLLRIDFSKGTFQIDRRNHRICHDKYRVLVSVSEFQPTSMPGKNTGKV